MYGHLTEIKALEDEVLSDNEISNISPWVDKELTDISVHPSNHTTYNFGAGGLKLPPKQITMKKKKISEFSGGKLGQGVCRVSAIPVSFL